MNKDIAITEGNKKNLVTAGNDKSNTSSKSDSTAKTGDHAQTGTFALLMLLSALTIAILHKKKRNNVDTQ